MRVVYADRVGESLRPAGSRLSDLPLSATLREALQAHFAQDLTLTPPQAWAVEQDMLNARAHFLVAAPTNSGKTLIALLRILHRWLNGQRRFVYVVPLKALAEEKAADLKALAVHLTQHTGQRLRIVVSTGDYPLTGDFPGSPPPRDGEIVICTPERLEVLLRNPDHLAWAKAVDSYVLDELHLLGEGARGARLETLITRLLIDCPDSALLGLSATIGGLDHIERWLGHTGYPVRVHASEFRYPLLHRYLVETDDKPAFVLDKAAEVLADPQRSLLVFVYKKADTERLAAQLRQHLAVTEGVAVFHAGLSLRQRLTVGQQFRTQTIRILISTTSLKMGINTPATDVIVRDPVFPGVGQLTTADILQMLGRAGRGEQPGHGYVLCGSREGYEHYATDLATGRFEEIHPQLLRVEESRFRSRRSRQESSPNPVHSLLLSEIARHPQLHCDQLSAFVTHTYSAHRQGLTRQEFRTELAFLEAGKLIYRVENSEATYSATKLGRTTSLCGLSPETGAMLAGFLRALINLSEKEKDGEGRGPNYLRRLTDLDFLLLGAASFEARDKRLALGGRREIETVREYIERLPSEDKPLVNLWRDPESPTHPTRRLLSTLRLPVDDNGNAAHEQLYYQMLRTVVLLHQHAQGQTLDNLAQRYGVHTGELESSLKSPVIWVLHGLAQICRSDRCYKLDYLAMRIYELLESLSLGAALGKLMTLDGVGRRSVEKLAQANITSLETLSRRQPEELVALGLTQGQTDAVLRLAKRSRR